MSDAPWLMSSQCQRESGLRKDSGATYRLPSQGFYETVEPVFTLTTTRGRPEGTRYLFREGDHQCLFGQEAAGSKACIWRRPGKMESRK